MRLFGSGPDMKRERGLAPSSARRLFRRFSGANVVQVLNDSSRMPIHHIVAAFDGSPRGDFAVTENGAVWVPLAGLGRRRALPFIAQHLVLVVEPMEVLHALHEAYARLRFEGPGFGLFIAGPSKTADIEQAQVIGAHGARSTVVFLVG